MLSLSNLPSIVEASQQAAGWIASISYPDLSPWAWGFLGVIAWKATKDLLTRPTRRRYRRSQEKQRQATRRNHKRWKAEGAKALAQFRKSPPADPDSTKAALNALTPFGFEYLITEGFRSQGAEVRKLKRVTGDGGIDGMVKLDDRWHLVQAKRYRSPVSAGMIHDFVALCREKRMPGLFVATSGFTRPASQIGEKHPRITLMDGHELIARINNT